jgi:hypothetical protein
MENKPRELQSKHAESICFLWSDVRADPGDGRLWLFAAAHYGLDLLAASKAEEQTI